MKASPRSIRPFLFLALAVGVAVLASSTFVPGGDRSRPESGEVVERSGSDGQEHSASSAALAQPTRVESVPEARRTAATHGHAVVPDKDVAPAIDDDATIQELRRRLREMDDEYRREPLGRTLGRGGPRPSLLFPFNHPPHDPLLRQVAAWIAYPPGCRRGWSPQQ
jgi:hypothetical protein